MYYAHTWSTLYNIYYVRSEMCLVFTYIILSEFISHSVSSKYMRFLCAKYTRILLKYNSFHCCCCCQILCLFNNLSNIITNSKNFFHFSMEFFWISSKVKKMLKYSGMWASFCSQHVQWTCTNVKSILFFLILPLTSWTRKGLSQNMKQ